MVWVLEVNYNPIIGHYFYLKTMVGAVQVRVAAHSNLVVWHWKVNLLFVICKFGQSQHRKRTLRSHVR